jgi:hypothetical protein
MQDHYTPLDGVMAAQEFGHLVVFFIVPAFHVLATKGNCCMRTKKKEAGIELAQLLLSAVPAALPRRQMTWSRGDAHRHGYKRQREVGFGNIWMGRGREKGPKDAHVCDKRCWLRRRGLLNG